LAETFDSDVSLEDATNGINVPISPHLHLAFLQPHLFYIAVQAAGTIQAKNMHFDDDVMERVSIDLHDAFGNRMIKINAIAGIIYDESFYEFMGFNREANKFIKIDNANSVKDASAITNLVGVI